MNKHEWVAIFTLHLTDKEAAQAYTFDHHGRKVLASKMTAEDGFVDVGCFRCESPYTEVMNKPCSTNQSQDKETK